MGSFSDWEMPIRYEGIASEHMAVREKVGLFDISHMGEIQISGGDALDLLQLTTSNDVSELDTGSAHYSTALNEDGGTKDDLFVYRTGELEYMVVVNAANTGKLFDWFSDFAEGEVGVEDITRETVMFALQGPKSEKTLQNVTDFDLNEVVRFGARWMPVADVRCLVSRSGYTGEDGFEIYIFEQARGSAEKASEVWDTLLKVGRGAGIQPCGLGARDSLRLEMGYPLYGHELTEEITPLEARISFAVDMEKPDFIGRGSLLNQKKEGFGKRRLGLKMKERGVPREGHSLFRKGEKVGEVTSGGFSPVLKKGIGMGYAPPGLEPGDDIEVEIRGQNKLAVVENWPFLEQE
ncbi:hypothetical protein AKJ55_01115 [candidate division MSBL1 archaeon SCGC-AAA382M17]|uniref:aminomethyltransferase n=1 Tax=candidate division MSBL1 archaeon SCGC-AAA382M17 TaxID=1698284 RepID=A0ABR5TJI6_9EURY|nr:hypothetical protein AKJ55_01115 [candidate division MSBL1 archaeon SCGC-AAA382M17]